MLKVFIGYDARQPVSYNVLQHSIISRSSQPVSITPLVLNQLPLKRQGLTPFTYSRFLVPYLNGFEGWALFLDADMLVLDDIAKLFEMADDRYSVMVVKNEHRFEWSSVMLFNCAKCKILQPAYIETADNLHGLGWANPDEIGGLPEEWNHLVGYDKPRDDAKLVHYTQGTPCFIETNTCEYADAWNQDYKRANYACAWSDLMGGSVHAVHVNGKPMPRYLMDIQNQKPTKGYERKVLELLNT